MTINIIYENESEQDLGLDPVKEAMLTAQKVLELEGCPCDVQICLTLTDPEGIQEANREFRGIDAVTDVLSFPMSDFAEPADFASVQEDPSCIDLDTGELLLGDILINTDRVISQAKEYGHSIRREYCFLVAHSVLHLVGYDHMEPDEAAVMEEKQEKALTELGITRESGGQVP